MGHFELLGGTGRSRRVIACGRLAVAATVLARTRIVRQAARQLNPPEGVNPTGGAGCGHASPRRRRRPGAVETPVVLAVLARARVVRWPGGVDRGHGLRVGRRCLICCAWLSCCRSKLRQSRRRNQRRNMRLPSDLPGSGLLPLSYARADLSIAGQALSADTPAGSTTCTLSACRPNQV